MGGVALLAKALGHQVSGSDRNVYPPMSDQLTAAGIQLHEGYDYNPAQLDPPPDQVIIGNALSRGTPAVEAVLAEGQRYLSGPQWLAENLLHERWVIAVAGTHGKTTTAAMVAWILEDAGLAPGFLIGGIPHNFGLSARIGSSPFFVVEADEYDTAFFDKRSKFLHYRPRTLILNNLEFDHADIFDDLAAIQRQFHHLLRTVPGNGLVIAPAADPALEQVIAMGCWTPLERTATPAGWHTPERNPEASHFSVAYASQHCGSVTWSLNGDHNLANALAALAAARHSGVPPHLATSALGRFGGVKRRMELRGEVNGICLYDDFAHHPTAIRLTLEGLRARLRSSADRGRIFALLDPRSNTMRMGVQADRLPAALAAADYMLLHAPPGLGWEPRRLFGDALAAGRCWVEPDVHAIIERTCAEARPGDHLLIMSNGGFENLHQRLLQALREIT